MTNQNLQMLSEALVRQAQSERIELGALLDMVRIAAAKVEQDRLETEQALAELLPAHRREEGLNLFAQGKPIPGLHEKYASPLVDEALEPLPDEIWEDLFK